MIILHTAGELRQWRQAQHGSIGFVPTMGNLHAGHLSLLRAARDQHPVAIASLFVNARQFDSADELNAYPVTVDADRDQLEKLGFDALFLPTASEVYPADFGTVVTPGSAARKWEGAFRPGHLEGVCTIVAKLFNLVQPDEAYFGEKDFQQLKVVAAMVRDLNIPVVISACPTIREADGGAENRIIFHYREGIERYLITDINNPGATAQAQSDLAIMWDITSTQVANYNHLPGGANVLYMDGHVEFHRYPGDPPVSSSSAYLMSLLPNDNAVT